MHGIELCMTRRQKTIVLFPGLLMVKLGGGGQKDRPRAENGGHLLTLPHPRPPPHFFGNFYNFAILDTIFRSLGRKCRI